MSLRATFHGPFPLRLTATNAPLAYELYELSACTVGILTLENLGSHDYLVMDRGGRRIPLRVAEILTPWRPPFGPVVQRYRLTCPDPALELDQLLDPEARGARRLQFPRCSVMPRLYVELRWPDREAVQLLESVDISRSGLLLRWTKGQQTGGLKPDAAFPLRLDVARLWLPETLETLGRIVRVDTSCMAVQLIDFPGPDAAQWTQLLRRIERGFLSGLTEVA